MAPEQKPDPAKVMNELGWDSPSTLTSRTWSAWLVGLCLFRALLGMPQAPVPAEAVTEFKQALDHFRAGSYPEALRVMEPLEQRHPRVAEIQHLLAIVLDLNRKPEEANRHFRRAVELQPDSVLFRTNLGASLMRLGRASEAAEEFEKALELEPNNPTASFNLGTILLQQGRPEQALPWLEKAFAFQPRVYENGYQLAYCQFLLGQYQAVDTVLKKLAAPATSRVELQLLEALTARALGHADGTQKIFQEMQPLLDGQPRLQFQVALLFLSQDLLDPAEGLLLLVTEQLPNFYPAHLNLARAQQGLAKLDQATRTAKAALALQETAEVHSLLGDLLEAQQKPLEAVAHFRQAVVRDPTPANYYALGHEFLIHWNWEAAAQVFSAALEKYPDSWDLWVGAGAAALGLTQYEEATRAFLRAVELKPEVLMGYQLLSQAFEQSKEAFDDAVGSFREFFKREAANPWAGYFEALASYRQASRSGDWSQLTVRVERLSRLTREDSHFLEALLLLSEIQFELRNWSGAVEALRQAIQRDPRNVLAHYRLGLALQRLDRSQEAQEILQRYQELKAQQDQSVSERVAATTRFIVELKQDDGPSQP